MDQRTYHYKLSWWLGILFISGFTMGWSLYAVIGYVRMISSPEILFNIIFLISISASIAFFAFGLLLFLVPFTTFIVISSIGIEVHTLGKLIRAPWRDVHIDMPVITGESVKVIHLTDPEVIIHPLTRYVPWKVKKEASDSIIRISQFGGLAPHKLIEDIQRSAPYLGMR